MKKLGMIIITILLIGFGYVKVKAYFQDCDAPVITFTSEKLMLLNGEAEAFYTVQDASSYTSELITDLNTIEEGMQNICIYAVDEYENEGKECKDMEVKIYHQELNYDYKNLTVDELMADVKERFSLTSSTFSIFYKNMVTEEAYMDNTDVLMLAASTVKLPVNMLYYDAIEEGMYSDDSTILYNSSSYEAGGGSTAYEYRAGDYIPLSYLLHQSIVYSDNTAVNILIHELGYQNFRYALSEYDTQDFPSDFYTTNQINANILYSLLTKLYANQDRYESLIEDMKEAMPEQYFKKYIKDVDIAHKYGLYGAYTHDVGIIYAEEPFLLGVLTYQVSDAEEVIAYIAQMLYEYQMFH